MDLSFVFVQILNGLASASSLFIIASGLTIVFGVTRIVNFAHGSLYMLGAYVAVSITPFLLDVSRSLPMFIAAVLIAGILVGIIGVAMEVLLLRRIYHAPELLQLLATFGIVLIVQDLVIRVWGPLEILGPRAPGLRHAILIFGKMFPAYELFLIACGPIVLGLLYLLMQKTRFGMLVRAATQDREMVGALGVNQALLFTGTLFLGAFLAGLGGALQIPKSAANGQMDIAVLSETFVVTVIGGMGSIPGAFLASLLIGQLQAFGILIFPKITLILVFLLMAVVLVLRPQGLLGRPEAPSSRALPPEGFTMLEPPGQISWALVIALAAILLVLPLVADSYTLKLAIEVLVFALAAFSLSLLIGNGGVVSFGHAAYFGLGAYAAGLLVTKSGFSMLPAIISAPIVAGAFAALYGAFIVRLSGIYLAMLTLAFAQITFAIAFQWVEVTGGDNGVVGVWPSAWASKRVVFYYLTLFLCAAAIAMLFRIIHSPFGYALRGARDSATRAEAIGLDVQKLRWLAFTIAGAAAGLGGALYAFSKGSIDPTLLSIPQSVDFLAMILTGGIQAIAGALAGAGVFHIIKDLALPLTQYWRALMGIAIIAIVLIFPHGIAGAAERLAPRLAPYLARRPS
jgi:branched-chain amino acid transport system permease protein